MELWYVLEETSSKTWWIQTWSLVQLKNKEAPDSPTHSSYSLKNRESKERLDLLHNFKWIWSEHRVPDIVILKYTKSNPLIQCKWYRFASSKSPVQPRLPVLRKHIFVDSSVFICKQLIATSHWYIAKLQLILLSMEDNVKICREYQLSST